MFPWKLKVLIDQKVPGNCGSIELPELPDGPDLLVKSKNPITFASLGE